MTAVNKILDTTQLFFDVYADSKHVYVRPEKVWNRDSDTMFLPHIYEAESGAFRPILDGVQSSRFYQTLGSAQRSTEEQYIDSWDRSFNRVKLLHENGVPTAFSDISAFDIICETEETKVGYNPELSYGSHIFQDLVESKILYTAVFRDRKTLHYAPEKLADAKDTVSAFDPGKTLAGIVHVYDVSDRDCRVYNDVADEHLVITC